MGSTPGDMFRHQADEVESVHDEPEVGASKGKYGGAAVKEDTAGTVLRGLGPRLPDPRKYRYDVVRAASAKVAFEVSKEDRMSAGEAGEKLHYLHKVYGVASENEDLLAAFDAALWFSHTVNGGSTLVPGRSIFSVPGRTKQFDYQIAVNVLGNDQRRFFRAYADDIAAVNKRVLAEYNPYDVYAAEKWGWLQQTAHSRGMQRFPHLSHDSADACLNLNSVERSALAESKKLVISSTPNSADKLRATDKVQSLDGYDSTVLGNTV